MTPEGSPLWQWLARQHLVLDHADDDLENGATNTATHQLGRERPGIHSAGRRCGTHHGTAAEATDGADDEIDDRAHIGILDGLSATKTADCSTDKLRDNCCEIH